MYKLIVVTLAVVSIGLMAATPAQAGNGCCCVKAAAAPHASAAVPQQRSEAAQAPQGTRRYSYEPSLDAPTRTYYQPRSYGGGMRSRSSAPAWSLQKTDPRKYRDGR